MYVPPETIGLPDERQDLDHQLAGIVRVTHNGGTEEKSLDIVAPVKLDHELRQLMGLERRAADIIGFPVDAIAAIISAGIAEEHLQESNAAAIGGKAVANAERGGIADRAWGAGAIYAAGRASYVVFCGIG